MTSKVFFRFKNAISQDQVLFDGSVIQIGDVKRLIAVKRGLGPEGAAELTLFDPNSNEEYTVDGKVIPRNSLVIVKRAPVTKFKPLQSSAPSASNPVSAAQAEPAPQDSKPKEASAAADEFGGDYYSEQPQSAVVGEDEDKALQNLLQGTAATWQREVRQGAVRGRGRGRGGRGVPPLDYRCSRCDAVAQHWVQDCPTQGDPNFDRKRIRPPIGIPMTRLAKSEEGGLILPDGQTGTLVANEDAFAREILGLPTASVEPVAAKTEPQAVQAAAAAGSDKKQEAIEGKTVLLLDNKAHEVKLEPAENSSDKAIHSNAMQPALPTLAGDEEMTAPVMPGAAFFNTFMQSVVMPRGPLEFVKKAFEREEPLSKSEFEELQADFRARRLSPPYHARGGHSPGRPAARPPHRSGSLSPEAHRVRELDQGRHSRDADAGKSRDRPSRSRSKGRRSSRERSDRKEGAVRRNERDGVEDGSHKRSQRSNSRHKERSAHDREKDAQRERESSRRKERERDSEKSRSRRDGQRRSDRSSEREPRQRRRQSKQDGIDRPEPERWRPRQEPTPEPEEFGTDSAPAVASISCQENDVAEEQARLDQKSNSSPVAAAVADIDARPGTPLSTTQLGASSGDAVVDDRQQQPQGNGFVKTAEMQVPDEEAKHHEGEAHDRHHKKHKKHKKEKKEKKDKKHKEKRKHRSRSRDRSASRGGEQDREAERLAAERLEQKKAEDERAQQLAAEAALRAEQDQQRAEQEAAKRRAQRRAEREKEKAAERAAARATEEEQAAARDKKLGPRLFDRAIVAAMKDKRPRHGDKAEGGEGDGSSKRSKRSRR